MKGIIDMTEYANKIKNTLKKFISKYELTNSLNLMDAVKSSFKEMLGFAQSILIMTDVEIYKKFYKNPGELNKLQIIKEMTQDIKRRYQSQMFDQIKKRYNQCHYIVHLSFDMEIDGPILKMLVDMNISFSKQCLKSNGISNPQLFTTSPKDFYFMDVVLEIEELKGWIELFSKTFKKYNLNCKINVVDAVTIPGVYMEPGGLEKVNDFIVEVRGFDFDALRSVSR
jgi:hypothetical protein